ncbi:MAG: hypothetical protein II843_02600 [Alphaproteobacteria bacterium]|nr:hypothetical protein [Alphaproteobacteria bacterium]MBQ6012215.1 hypothetical protein [Alphaproteobacteria bacterium]
MTDNDYITINENGVFVGGQPATHYRGVEIAELDRIKNSGFRRIKKYAKEKYNRDVSALHCMSSETQNTLGHQWPPSPNPGNNKWYRLEFSDGSLSLWQGMGAVKYKNPFITEANLCACLCAMDFIDAVPYRLFGFKEEVFFTESYNPRITWGTNDGKVIHDNDYITINENGIFIGSVPTLFYRDSKLFDPQYAIETFKKIKDLVKTRNNLDVSEVHGLSSETPVDGSTGDIGNPKPNHGSWLWYRMKFKDGKLSPWVNGADFVGDCATGICAAYCAFYVNSLLYSGCYTTLFVEKRGQSVPRQQTASSVAAVAQQQQNVKKDTDNVGEDKLASVDNTANNFCKQLKSKILSFIQKQHQ